MVKGKIWWDTVRQEAYRSTDYHCAACGVHKSQALYHQWLEAHEVYDFDYFRGTMILKELVPLCHACHNAIHDGRMQAMVDRGEMPRSKQQQILRHKDQVTKGLRAYNPSKPKNPIPWTSWRLIIDGNEYGPSTNSYEEWQQGLWREWTPIRRSNL